MCPFGWTNVSTSSRRFKSSPESDSSSPDARRAGVKATCAPGRNEPPGVGSRRSKRSVNGLSSAGVGMGGKK